MLHAHNIAGYKYQLENNFWS